MELKDKLVLVTGGGTGIGLGIALAFAQEGCQVVIAGRRAEKLREAAAQFTGHPPILTRSCDVSHRPAVSAMIAEVEQQRGTPDILVNSAGINIARRAVAELDPADWDRLLDINVTGAFNCIQRVLPGMRKRRSGLIVNISSVAGKRALKLGGVAYCASKFAMTALGMEVGLEERPNGIHVTNIYPGEVATPILANRPVPVPPERVAQMLQPEDIAALVVAIAKLPPRALVPEVVMTPLYQEYA
jgi:NAD(P)-dependent dehydrogenase (short-subunit alcohol dehydrogenase family)